jgi:cellulose biosynthesis protein BcsQ
MVITSTSWKGGTGKTTLNTMMARLLAEFGKQVLLIDLDSNCALGQIFGCMMKDNTSMQFLSGVVEKHPVVYKAAPNIDIMPSDIRISRLSNVPDNQLRISLKRAGLLEMYDYIIIDPPGYWGAHTRNAVYAADVVVIPATCSAIDYAATGLYFEELKACEIEADVRICINCFNLKTNLPGIYEKYTQEFGEFMTPEPIPYISSLKKLTGIAEYKLNPAVKSKLARFVDAVAGGKNA